MSRKPLNVKEFKDAVYKDVRELEEEREKVAIEEYNRD